MKIKLASILVADQSKALAFYTDVLGFVKKEDVAMGEYRWLTVQSAEEENGTELVLEPMAFEPARIYQKSLYDAGIPCTAFHSDNVENDYNRLTALGVTFKMAPTKMGPVTLAMFDDTCGNYVQMVQV
jgi:predicted enzyme related to lactoylglutathione lyase